MKKIAIVSDVCPPHLGGGIGSAHLALFNGLRTVGYPVKMFTYCDYRLADDEDTVEIIRFGSPKRLRKYLVMMVGWFFRVAEPGKTAWNTADVFDSAIGAWQMNKAIQVYDPDVVLFPDQGAPAWMVRKPEGSRFGLIAHHNPMRFVNDSVLGDFSVLDAKIAVYFENLALRKVDKVSAPSHHMAEWFVKTYEFSDAVQVIPNLADMSDLQDIAEYDIRMQLGLPADAILLGIPSAQMRIKGSHLVFELLQKIAIGFTQPFGVFIAGRIDETLERQLADLPEQIKLYLPGKLEREAYLQVFKMCSFGLFPSLRDNYSMALVEASVLGVPMLAFDAGGNADIIVSDKNGTLLPEINVDEMVTCALGWMQNPKALRSLKNRTQQYAKSVFDPQVVLQQYIDYFIE